MANLKVNIAGVEFKNPVMPASGTFGFGYDKLFDFKKLGAIISKGITLQPRDGNDAPRIAETPGGLINSVGLQNAGVENFVKYMIPYYKTKNDVIIANIAGFSVEEYKQLAMKFNDTKIDLLEVNISCPNVENGGMVFSISSKAASEVVSAIKKVSTKPIIVKLSPNVTDIVEIAKAVEDAGADAISLINTILSMRIDINTRQPILKNNMGGLSGPAVFPIALRMVYQVANAVSIPIIGMGGITNYKQAIEMMMAGATAIQVGSSMFTEPKSIISIIDGLDSYLNDNNIDDINSIVKSVKPW